MSLSCHSCKSRDIIEDRDAGDMICRSCGLVLGAQIMDNRASYRDNEVNFSSIWGDPTERRKRRKFAAGLRKCEKVAFSLDLRMQNSIEEGFDGPKRSKRFFDAMEMIKYLRSSMALSKVSEDGALQDLEEMSQSGSLCPYPRWIPNKSSNDSFSSSACNLPQRSGASIGAALVFNRCRVAGHPRTLDEICGVANISKVDLGRTYRIIREQTMESADGERDMDQGCTYNDSHSDIIFTSSSSLRGNSQLASPRRKPPTKRAGSKTPHQRSGGGASDKGLESSGGGDIGGPRGVNNGGSPDYKSNHGGGQAFNESAETRAGNDAAVKVTSSSMDHATKMVRCAVVGNAHSFDVVDNEKLEALSKVMTLPHQLVPRFSGNLRLPRQLQLLATEIAKRLTNLELLTGRSPQIQAATAIYMAHLLFPGCQVEKEDMAKEANVTATKIISSYKMVVPHWRLLLPTETQQKVGNETLSAIML